ncbi:MAG: VanZ family protein [Chloroflexota bacterium]|nr:VanZ family protein [Chloroflexota bacterium]
MSIFTSRRERRLWTWTLIVVGVLYSTLGVTPKVAASLLSKNLNAALFVVGMMLVGATIISRGLKIRLSGANLGIVLGVAAAYVLVFVRFTSTEERSHLIEYGVVAAFIHEALEERARQGRPVPFYPLIAILATALIGVVDELIQHFIPNRVFDPQDIFFNTLAGAIAVAGISALAWAQRRTDSYRLAQSDERDQE